MFVTGAMKSVMIIGDEMKRSQMLEVIEEALYCHVTPGSNLACVAECVMQSIEGGNKTGIKMLPDSFYYNDSGFDTLISALYDMEIAPDLGCICWEEE